MLFVNGNELEVKALEPIEHKIIIAMLVFQPVDKLAVYTGTRL